MARLYNGIDGLGLGRSVNDLWNQQYLQRKQNMDSFANGMTQLMQGLGEQREQARQKQSAIDFLTRNGMTAADAQSLADSGLAPGELTKYMQGRLDKSVDLKAAQERADFEYGRAREDKLNDEEWDREIADLDKMQKRKDEIEDSEFKAINEEIAILQSKINGGGLVSQADLDAMNNALRKKSSWLKAHPWYTQFEDNLYGNGNNAGTSALWTDKKATDALYGLIDEKDGKVDSAALKALDEKYLRDTGRTLAKDLPDLYKNIAQKQRGSKGKRNADNPNSGNITTEEDYKKIYNDAVEMKRLRGIYSRMVEELSTGKPLTQISATDLKILEAMERDGKFKQKGGITLYKNKMKRGR